MAAALPPSVLKGTPKLPLHVPATWWARGGGEDKPTKGGGGESEEEESCSASIRLLGHDAVCGGARKTLSGSVRTELLLSEHDVTSPSEPLKTGPLGVLLQGQDSLQVLNAYEDNSRKPQALIPRGQYPHSTIPGQRIPPRLRTIWKVWSWWLDFIHIQKGFLRDFWNAR